MEEKTPESTDAPTISKEDQKIINSFKGINPDANNLVGLIEKAVEGKWGKLKDVITKIPGDTIFPENELEIEKPPLNEHKVHTIFVVFVGGITYNEIAGIRFINRKLKLAFDK